MKSQASLSRPKRGPKASESLLNGSWSALGGVQSKKNVLEASWSRLGALKMASRWPDTVRGEVRERSREHLWLAMAPGSATYQRISINNNNKHPLQGGSEHALGQRPGELSEAFVFLCAGFVVTPAALLHRALAPLRELCTHWLPVGAFGFLARQTFACKKPLQV